MENANRRQNGPLPAELVKIQRIDPWLWPLTILAMVAAMVSGWTLQDYDLVSNYRGYTYLTQVYGLGGFALGVAAFLAFAFGFGVAPLGKRLLAWSVSLGLILASYLLGSGLYTDPTFGWKHIESEADIVAAFVIPAAVTGIIANQLFFPIRLFRQSRKRKAAHLWIDRQFAVHRIAWIISLVILLGGGMISRSTDWLSDGPLSAMVVVGIFFAIGLYLIMGLLAWMPHRIIACVLGVVVMVALPLGTAATEDLFIQYYPVSGAYQRQAAMIVALAGSVGISTAFLLLMITGRLPRLVGSTRALTRGEATIDSPPSPAGRAGGWPIGWVYGFVAAILLVTAHGMPLIYDVPIFLAFAGKEARLARTVALLRQVSDPTAEAQGYRSHLFFQIHISDPPGKSRLDGIVITDKNLSVLEDTGILAQMLSNRSAYLYVCAEEPETLQRLSSALPQIQSLTIDGRQISQQFLLDWVAQRNPTNQFPTANLHNMRIDEPLLSAFPCSNYRFENCQFSPEGLGYLARTQIQCTFVDCPLDPMFADWLMEQTDRVRVSVSELSDLEIPEQRLRRILAHHSIYLETDWEKIRAIGYYDYNEQKRAQAREWIKTRDVTDATRELLEMSLSRKSDVVFNRMVVVDQYLLLSRHRSEDTTLFRSIPSEKLRGLKGLAVGAFGFVSLSQQLANTSDSNVSEKPVEQRLWDLKTLILMTESVAYMVDTPGLNRALQTIDPESLKTFSTEMGLMDLESGVQKMSALENLAIMVRDPPMAGEVAILAKMKRLKRLRLGIIGTVNFSPQGIQQLKQRWEQTLSQAGIGADVTLVLDPAELPFWSEFPSEQVNTAQGKGPNSSIPLDLAPTGRE